MDKIKCFIECLIPVTACNIKCSYCYVVQRSGRTGKVPPLQFSIETIRSALSCERFGGTCYFSICGAGETLIPDYTLEIVRALLENGHYVNVTTNGTLTRRFDQLRDWAPELLSRLHFAFSFHYLELVRTNRIGVFFDNVSLVKSLGCSFVVQLNLCDEYLPHIDEIKELCLKNVGALPQVAATRKEVSLNSKILFDTELSDKEYIAKGKEFDSPLFDFTIRNFNVKRREFCYAGSWTYQLNLLTGILKPCYHSLRQYNIYEDLKRPIKHRPVGCSCGSLFCMNSSHFMSLGVIPTIDTPSYASLRDRPEAGWYSPTMRRFLDGKLKDSNVQLGKAGQLVASLLGRMENGTNRIKMCGGKVLRALKLR